MIQVWIVHHIQIIGEAARALSDEIRARHNQIPWPLIGMRHILVHNYFFGIDLDEVWSVVERDLPRLKENVRAILAQT